jgi:ABC-type transporter Mla maintaining outer membrane lipid asymmetry ATPase subunit MlaF
VFLDEPTTGLDPQSRITMWKISLHISVASGNIYVTVQNNSDTRNIGINQKFYVTNQPFKVTGIERDLLISKEFDLGNSKSPIIPIFIELCSLIRK